MTRLFWIYAFQIISFPHLLSFRNGTITYFASKIFLNISFNIYICSLINRVLYDDEYESHGVGFLVLHILDHFWALVHKLARMLAHILHVLARVMAYLHHI